MAQRKLPIGHRISLMAIPVLALLQGCRAEEPAVGMTLVYECEGPKIMVRKFQAEGMRNSSPGVVGCGPKGGAQMAFMPGDNEGKMPSYVDVEWFVQTAQSEEAFALIPPRKGGRIAKDESDERQRQIEEAWAKALHATQRIDLNKAISTELMQHVRANAQTTQLRLTMTFKSDQLEVKAQAYKWRQ